jgi:hypothetical protein
MKNYIPKEKVDIKALDYLKTLSFEEISSEDIPELLVWFQDLNWGNANGIAAFLMPYINNIKNELITILNGKDGQWKRGILAALVAKTSAIPDPQLLSIITRIAKQPSEDDKEEGVDIVANKIISKFN